MQLTDRLLTLRQSDQHRVITRIFQKLSTAFGNQLLSKWQGVDMDAVYSDWAESLGQLSLGAINYGIEQAKNNPHPPNIGEFLTCCKGYKPPELIKIESKLTPEQIARNKERFAQIAKDLLRRKTA